MTAGREMTPKDVEDTARLKRYWLLGPGRAKWDHPPTPWTNLFHHLSKYLPPELAKKTAARWFIEAKGYASGSDINRVMNGAPPRGKRIGPG